MLKHVHISPLRNRSDSISLRSSTTFSMTSSCASSLCGSPEPPTDSQISTPSRSSSYSSLTDSNPQVNKDEESFCTNQQSTWKKFFSELDEKLKLNFPCSPTMSENDDAKTLPCWEQVSMEQVEQFTFYLKLHQKVSQLSSHERHNGFCYDP